MLMTDIFIFLHELHTFSLCKIYPLSNPCSRSFLIPQNSIAMPLSFMPQSSHQLKPSSLSSNNLTTPQILASSFLNLAFCLTLE